jgi:hypothetical protein
MFLFTVQRTSSPNNMDEQQHQTSRMFPSDSIQSTVGYVLQSVMFTNVYYRSHLVLFEESPTDQQLLSASLHTMNRL